VLVAVVVVVQVSEPVGQEVPVVVETVVLVTPTQDKLLELLIQVVVAVVVVTVVQYRLEPTAVLVSLSSKSHLRTMPHSHLV
jgi:hypothetical protein